jgi:uncharacterized protein
MTNNSCLDSRLATGQGTGATRILNTHGRWRPRALTRRDGEIRSLPFRLLPLLLLAAPVLGAPLPQGELSAATGRVRRVVLITGQEHPAHRWRETAPLLKEIVERDPRLQVTVVEDAKFLGSPELKNYDVILLNYMNHNDPGPGPGPQEAFRAAVEGGTGLVLFHFACGAFQGWPPYVQMAGRVWDPKRRGHDPYGPFRVQITDLPHPVTADLADFDTTDELYTCLAGEEAIDVLATARSKVDNMVYPMAFARLYGKGRVFQCVLGHDVNAMKTPEVGALFRRGCAWAAGLDPSD